MTFVKTAAAAAALAAVLVSGVAFAHDAGKPGQQRVKPSFELWDTNKDGGVTLAEMKAALANNPRKLEHADMMFTKLDTNKNGSITKAEFDAWKAKRKGHRGGHGEHKK